MREAHKYLDFQLTYFRKRKGRLAIEDRTESESRIKTEMIARMTKAIRKSETTTRRLNAIAFHAIKNNELLTTFPYIREYGIRRRAREGAKGVGIR